MRKQSHPAQPRARARVPLTVVDPEEAAGFAVPILRPRRGSSDTDYACGRCLRLLFIGGAHGVFRSLLLACPCGALNRPP